VSSTLRSGDSGGHGALSFMTELGCGFAQHLLWHIPHSPISLCAPNRPFPWLNDAAHAKPGTRDLRFSIVDSDARLCEQDDA